MKIKAVAVFALMCAAFLSAPVSAATYIDNMDSLNGDGVKRYTGLTEHSFSKAAASAVPDATALTLSDGRLVSYADYRVNGAARVTAAIYSQSGTFVSQDNRSQHMLGVYKDNMEFSSFSAFTQALYCAETGGVYTREGGLKQMYTDLNAFYFGEIIDPPQVELTGYGLNIYYSNDGKSFARVQAEYSYLAYSASYACCVESFTAQVPATAKYVRVEINDFAAAPIESGGSYAKDKRLRTALASVTISGAALTAGEPEPGMSLPSGGAPQSGASGGYYSAKTDTSKPEASVKADAEGRTEKTKEPASKFEGTITSSSKAERSSSKPEATARAASSESGAASVSSAEEIPPDETIVYDIRRPGEKTGFDKGVTAYIIIVSGVILALAVLPKRK